MVTNWIRMLICFGMAFMMLMLVVSGDFVFLVNPKFRILMILSILLLIILGWVQCLHLKTRDLHSIGFWGYFFVAFPIFVYLFIPPKALDASMIEKKGITLVSSKQVTNQPTSSPTSKEPTEDQTAPYKEALKEMKTTDYIVFDEKNYSEYLSVLELYPKELVGKKIRIKGFVFRDDPSLKKDEFILSRFTISCCAADASVVGVKSQFPQASILKTDQWIEVEGVLRTTKRFEFDAPMIEIQSYRLTKAPKDPYIYF